MFIHLQPAEPRRARSAKTKVITGRVSVLTVSWADPGPLPGTQMGFVSHAEHQTRLFRQRQQGRHYKNACFRSPWRTNGQFGPPAMQSLAPAAALEHKYRLKATRQHRNCTEITRPRQRCTSFSLWLLHRLVMNQIAGVKMHLSRETTAKITNDST